VHKKKVALRARTEAAPSYQSLGFKPLDWTPQMDELVRAQKLLELQDLDFFTKFPEYLEFRRLYVHGEFWPTPVPLPPEGLGWCVDVTKVDNVNRVRVLIAVKVPEGWDPKQVWPGESRRVVH
jgi:hypothetical protein